MSLLLLLDSSLQSWTTTLTPQQAFSFETSSHYLIHKTFDRKQQKLSLSLSFLTPTKLQSSNKAIGQSKARIDPSSGTWILYFFNGGHHDDDTIKAVFALR